MMVRFVFPILCFIILDTSALAGTRILKKKSMSFQQCVATIGAMASKLGVAPVNIVETNILRLARFSTNDGSGKSYLITCSKPDRMLILNESW